MDHHHVAHYIPTVLVDRIETHRRCRDVPFLVLFVVFWCGMLVAAGIAFREGNPRRLVYGLDYKGNLCGSSHGDPNLQGYNIRYWMNPKQVIESGDITFSVSLRDARAICLRACPPIAEGINSSLSWVCDYPEINAGNSTSPLHQLTIKDWADRNYSYFELLDATQRLSSLRLEGPCYPVLIETTSLFWSCQPEANISFPMYELWRQINGSAVTFHSISIWDSVNRYLSDPSAVLQRYVADLGKAWPVLVVCSAIAPLVLCSVWLVFVRFFARFTVWLTIILVNALAILVMLLFYVKAGSLKKSSVEAVVGAEAAATVLGIDGAAAEREHLKVTAILYTLVLAVLLLFSAVMLRRIHFASGILKVASKAMAAIPTLLVFPILPFAASVLFGIFWVYVASYLFSAGDVTRRDCLGAEQCRSYSVALLRTVTGPENCCGYDIKYNTRLKWAMVYHIFGCFWTLQFILACSMTTIAGAVASFYWTKSDKAAIPFHPVTNAATRTIRYSLGSMALGSLVIGIVGLIRWLCEYLRRKLLADDTSVIRYVCCCTEYCLVCLDYVVKFVNRNAYIIIAIKGYGFCQAAARASMLIVDNILRVAAVSVLGDFALFLAKLMVSFACAFLAFLMLEDLRYKSGENRVSSPLAPVLFCMGVSFIVAYIFFTVVEVAMDTIILSFCEDCEENNNVPIFAPRVLMETIKMAQDEHEHRARRRERRRRRTEAEHRIPHVAPIVHGIH
ncbi:hypothetical protein CBR_g34644 [Chara braunii]|uniref:Choline transporter-like protein n=1 Tax=Chara braunii TaxID=69332 RepID=A0A388LJ49_CHABU|nr:hypothetical protein CBR_g34644 [Chara braunii]|eukprot:GBG82360.1 hypothetical protein CBR_g34644 [Chara braunii]